MQQENSKELVMRMKQVIKRKMRFNKGNEIMKIICKLIDKHLAIRKKIIVKLLNFIEKYISFSYLKHFSASFIYSLKD